MKLLSNIVLFVFLVSIMLLPSYFFYSLGKNTGIDDYHNLCYTYGGLVVHNELVVKCEPVAQARGLV